MRLGWKFAVGRWSRNRRPAALCATALMAASAVAVPAFEALAQNGPSVGKSGLPVPRFVSLKAKRVNVRVGPGEDYKISWIFTKPGLPIEVVQEFDTWRRVRDSDGEMGWVFHSLLSGKRTGVVAPWSDTGMVPVLRQPRDGAAIRAYLEPGVVGEIGACDNGWCSIEGERYSGWIRQERLWGVYPDETIE